MTIPGWSCVGVYKAIVEGVTTIRRDLSLSSHCRPRDPDSMGEWMTYYLPLSRLSSDWLPIFLHVALVGPPLDDHALDHDDSTLVRVLLYRHSGLARIQGGAACRFFPVACPSTHSILHTELRAHTISRQSNYLMTFERSCE